MKCVLRRKEKVVKDMEWVEQIYVHQGVVVTKYIQNILFLLVKDEVKAKIHFGQTIGMLRELRTSFV